MLVQVGNQTIISSICGYPSDVGTYTQEIGEGEMRKSGGRCALLYFDMPSRFMSHLFIQCLLI